MTRSIVSILRTRPETVLSDICELMESSEAGKALAKGADTILKDNISWHFPFLSANTTPWQLEGTIRGLKKMEYVNITAVHNNTVVTNPFKGIRLNKLKPVYVRHGIPERYNFSPRDMQWKVYRPRGRTRILHRIYPEGIRIPDFFLDKNIVHLPTIKCHIYTTITGSMKNAFGGLLNTKRHYTHSFIHETLVDLLLIQKEIHKGIFTVMDGTICGNGAGPRTMLPVQKDLILAGADPVAVDAVAAKIMGFDPMGIDHIRLAHEDGLGTGKIEDIEIRGEDISNMNFHFKAGQNLISRFGRLFWFGHLREFQRIFFRTPLVYLFVFGSYFYHDLLWWPIIGRRLMEVIAANSSWGKMFSEYK